MPEVLTEWQGGPEELQVRNWRFERLMALGFDVEEAELLASSTIELSMAERLIDRGCSTSLAFCILM